MVRQPSKYSANSNDIAQVLQFMEKFPKDLFNDLKPKSPIFLGVKLNQDLEQTYGPDVKFYTKSYSSYIISDSTVAIIIALGITPENVNDYLFHVVENDSIEIIPWSPIPKMEQDYGAKQPYANLGTYNSPGNQLLIEVMNKNDYFIRDGIIFDWRINF